MIDTEKKTETIRPASDFAADAERIDWLKEQRAAFLAFDEEAREKRLMDAAFEMGASVPGELVVILMANHPELVGVLRGSVKGGRELSQAEVLGLIDVIARLLADNERMVRREMDFKRRLSEVADNARGIDRALEDLRLAVEQDGDVYPDEG